MHFQTAVLALVLMALPVTYGDVAQCDKDNFHDNVAKLRTLVQKMKSEKHISNSFLASEALGGMAQLIEQMEVMTQSCPPEEKQQINFLFVFLMGLMAGEINYSEAALGHLGDKRLREDVLSLVYAIDSKTIFEFIEGLDEAESKVNIYQNLLNLMQNTQLNNTELVTSVALVEKLNTLAAKENDTNVAEILRRLLRQAIETDMVLRHDNLEQLYRVNYVVTEAVVEEIISKYINAVFESADDVEEFPLFEMLKCTTDKALWLQHLEMIFNKLHETNKDKSVYTLILLKELKTLEKVVDGDLRKKVVALKTKLPAVLEKVLSGKGCLRLDEDANGPKVFISAKEDSKSFLKWVPKEEGEITAVSGILGNDSLIAFLKGYDQTQDLFANLNVKLERGDLEPLEKEELSNYPDANVCLPLADILPPARLLPSHVGAMKYLAKFILHSQRDD